jgi:putative NADH-flavin reductase
MKITVFGASGGVGQKFVELAIHNGHSVRAVFRKPPALEQRAGLEILVGRSPFDILFIKEAIHSADVVVSAVGLRRKYAAIPWSKLLSPPDFVSSFSKLLIEAVSSAGAPQKIFFIRAAGVGDTWSRVAPALKLLFKSSNIGVAYQDLAVAENRFKASGLNWHCIRPTTLTNGPLTKKVKLTDFYGLRSKVSRSNVAGFILDQIEGSNPPEIQGMFLEESNT